MNLPPPSPLIALDWKLACGNFAVSNQGLCSLGVGLRDAERGAADVDRSATLPASGCFGSSAIWASNFLNRPSTGTPICLLTNDDLALAGTSLATASGRGGGPPSSAAATHSVQPLHANHRNASRRCVPGPHAPQQAVTVDELVLEAAATCTAASPARMKATQRCSGLSTSGERLVHRHEVRQRQHAEPDDREAGRRTVGPAEQRHGEEQDVHHEWAIGSRGLPRRHRREPCRRQRRRAVREAPRQRSADSARIVMPAHLCQL